VSAKSGLGINSFTLFEFFPENARNLGSQAVATPLLMEADCGAQGSLRKIATGFLAWIISFAQLGSFGYMLIDNVEVFSE